MSELDYQLAAQAAQHVVRAVLEHQLPKGILLNVNIPHLPEGEIKGFRTTRQGLRVYRNRLDRRQDPRGNPYYWISGDALTGIPESGTDLGALAEGYVSITPIQLDLTAYPVLQALRSWNWQAEHESSQN